MRNIYPPRALAPELAIVSLPDPVIEQIGHGPDSPYIEETLAENHWSECHLDMATDCSRRPRGRACTDDYRHYRSAQVGGAW
jgi:hypothetical protein